MNNYNIQYFLVMDNYNASIQVGEEKVNLDLWDTAGQEEFVHIRKLSYPKTDCFVCCYSTVKRSSLSNVKTLWIPEVRGAIPNVPFILCGTKKDLMEINPSTAVSQKDALKVCKALKGYDSIQCSAMQFENKEQSKIGIVFKTAITCALEGGITDECVCNIL